MKLQISESAAGAFAVLAITARITGAVLIDMPDLMNAGWLSILFGALFALPVMLMLSTLRKSRQNDPFPVPRVLYVVFLIISIHDAASVAGIIADSAGYLALNSNASFYLMIPQFILCIGCLLLNGDALGASASVWNKLLPFILLIVILLQAGNYQPQWLAPLFGPGVSSIAGGTLRTAGWFCLPTALLLIAEKDVQSKPGHLRPLRILALCVLFSTLIAVSFSMITPAIADENLFSRTFRFDALLANGRNSLSLQLPAIVLWYTGQFYALLFDVFTCAVMVQRIIPRWPRNACVCISIISTALFAASGFSRPGTAIRYACWLYPILGVSVATCLLYNIRSKGAARHA